MVVFRMQIPKKAKNGITHDLAVSFLDIYLKNNSNDFTTLIKETPVPQCTERSVFS